MKDGKLSARSGGLLYPTGSREARSTVAGPSDNSKCDGGQAAGLPLSSSMIGLNTPAAAKTGKKSCSHQLDPLLRPDEPEQWMC